MTDYQQSQVSNCGTFHINGEGKPLYQGNTFNTVLPFHPPGLAPVQREGKAWHILADGNAAYPFRFDKTFGFYCGYAAVCDNGNWFHIKTDGSPLYSEHYSFAGNYQQNVCVVCDSDNYYFHIDESGIPLYKDKWKYCGDYREGIAVVQRYDGLHSHIDRHGILIHIQWFKDLDVYHKGFARARNSDGWHHIDKNGHSVYLDRFANIEPFYNGNARVETHSGEIQIIDEHGVQQRILRKSQQDEFSELSADLVGYWRTFTIATAVELGIFDSLPSNTNAICNKLNLDNGRLERLLRALAELNLINEIDALWQVTAKGHFLLSDHPTSLAKASLEYQGDLLERWRRLPTIISGGDISQDVFISVAEDNIRRLDHHQMLSSYARHDYASLIELLGINSGDIVFDAAGGTGTLSELIASRTPKANIVCGDLPQVVAHQNKLNINFVGFDLFKAWPIQANKIILSRVIHDWDDYQALTILTNAKNALLSNGEILIIEMLLPTSGYSGSLCDLHLMAVTGGKERTLNQFELLIEQAKLALHEVQSTQSLASILRIKF